MVSSGWLTYPFLTLIYYYFHFLLFNFLFGMTLRLSTCWQLTNFSISRSLSLEIYSLLRIRQKSIRSDTLKWEEAKNLSKKFRNLLTRPEAISIYRRRLHVEKLGICPCFRVHKRSNLHYIWTKLFITHQFRSVRQKRGLMWLKWNQCITHRKPYGEAGIRHNINW